MSTRNPVKPLPWNEGAFDTFQKYGVFMFPQQKKIYENIARNLPSHSTVLEAGCGIGLGTAILGHSLTTKIVGTDNLVENVKIAKQLYPWIVFEQWDVLQPYRPTTMKDVVVCVETIEHVEDAQKAMINLCRCALKEVWLSTPNGSTKKKPPENPYHVQELTTYEVLDLLKNIKYETVDILDYDSFSPISLDTHIDPIVYRIKL